MEAKATNLIITSTGWLIEARYIMQKISAAIPPVNCILAIPNAVPGDMKSNG